MIESQSVLLRGTAPADMSLNLAEDRLQRPRLHCTLHVHRPMAFRRPPPPSLYVLSYPRALTFMTEEDYLPPEHGDNRGRISFDKEERSKRVREGNILSLCMYASASLSPLPSRRSVRMLESLVRFSLGFSQC